MKRNGFTLIELMAVLGITAILTLVVMPKASDTFLDLRLSSTVRQIHHAIITARQMAMAEQRAWQVSLTSSNRVLLYRDTDYLNDVKEYRVVLPSSVTFLNPNTYQFRFNVYGEPTQLESIGIKNAKGKILYIIIARSGRVRISRTPA